MHPEKKCHHGKETGSVRYLERMLAAPLDDDRKNERHNDHECEKPVDELEP